jgi:hypothetical protein
MLTISLIDSSETAVKRCRQASRGPADAGVNARICRTYFRAAVNQLRTCGFGGRRIPNVNTWQRDHAKP